MKKKQEKELRDQIRALVKKGWPDQSIAQAMHCSRTRIIWLRQKFQTHTEYQEIKTRKLREKICQTINAEPPQYCRTDRDIAKIMTDMNYRVSLKTVGRHRIAMKIPPARRCRESILTRQYLYFTKEGRIVWMPDGNHYYAHNKKPVRG